MQLYLVRHPQVEVDAGVCYGQTDLDLASQTADSPTVLANALARVQPLLPSNARYYSSPLKRCRRLAEQLSADYVIDERLREIDFGEWEMQRWDDIPRNLVDEWAADPLFFAGHGGESVAEMQRRVTAFLTELADQEVVLMTHAGVMKIIVGLVLGLAAEDWLGLKFDYASVTCLALDQGSGRLLWHNSAHA